MNKCRLYLVDFTKILLLISGFLVLFFGDISAFATTIKHGKTRVGESLKKSTNLPSSWQLSGAILARSKNKTITASINWVQNGKNNYQMRFFGPIGSGTIVLKKQGDKVTFRDGAKIVSANDASAILRKQTGISLPIQNLYYWVRGIAAPGGGQGTNYKQTRLFSSLKQAGYRIDYQQYMTVGDTTLPKRIILQGQNIFVKLVIRQWHL